MNILDFINQNTQILYVFGAIAMISYIIGRSRCYGSYWHEMFHDIWFDLKMWSIDAETKLESLARKMSKHRRLCVSLFVVFEIGMILNLSRQFWSDHNTLAQTAMIIGIDCFVIGTLCFIVIQSERKFNKQKVKP